MSALSIQPTYPIFTETDGQPLEDGYIWLGVANLDPQGNPINVYWDAALTQLAGQPIRTQGGYPVNSGTPARLYVNSDYSIRVMNKNGSMVYSAPAATERYNGVVVTVDATNVTFTQSGTGAIQTTAQVKFEEWVHVADFGASPSASTSVNTTALINAFAAATGKALVFANGVYQVNQLIATGDSIAIIGNNATIEYTANVNEPSLDLTDCSVQDITFDGSGFNVGKSIPGVEDSAVIKAQGESFRMVNVTFRDLHGLQDNYQYGAVVNAATRSLVSNCKFIEIKTRTDSTNTGGFCGGYMINAAQGVPMTPSTHLIENCLFQDIYTTRNNLGQLYDDSDGVRAYFYDIGTGVPGYDAAVRATTITVNNCSFVNVLKSACKLQDCNSYINDCRVVVNDLKSEGQTSVYTGFRYQQGNYISVSNCSVVGPIRLGALLVGDNSFCNNFYFGAQNVVGTDQYGLTIGRVAGTFDPTASTIDYCGVTNFTCSGTDYSLDIYGCDEIFADGCKLEGPIAVIHCDQLFVTNSTLTNMIQNAHRSPYFPYLKKVIFDNCYINNNTTGFYQNNILSADPIEFVVENTKLEDSREQFIETAQTINIKISNCNLMVNDPSNSGRKFLDLVSVAKLRIYDTTITDTREATSPAQMIITGANTEFVDVDGLVFNAKTASNYTNAIYMAPGGANPVLSNIVFNDLPSGCTAIDCRNTTNPALSNIRCNYADANLNFFGGSNAIVNMFYGTLRATPNHITTGGGVVLHEYNTTFL